MLRLFVSLISAAMLFACGAPQVKLFSDATDPLKEYTIEGTGEGKVLMISIRGIISTQPEERFLRTMPSMVQEIVSQLARAEADEAVKSVLITIDSPGGTTTASDILYHEIMAFKARSGKNVVVAMMGVAASGAYYLSLPADVIYAHPTTITGSVGVILIQPDFTGLMDKIGLGVHVSKSGRNKDMGAFYRRPSSEEKRILQNVTDDLAQRFLDLVGTHRRLEAAVLSDVSTARVYLAREALALKLVDKIGYLSDAIQEAKTIAGLEPDARVVAYRRSAYPDDNRYNPSTSISGGPEAHLLDVGLPRPLPRIEAGFYYLWTPALGTTGD